MSYARQAIVLIAGTLCTSALGSAIVGRILNYRYDIDFTFYTQLGWWAGGFLAVALTAVFSRSRPYALVGYVVGCALAAADWRIVHEQVVLTTLTPPDDVEWSVSALMDFGPLVLACIGLALAQDDCAASLGVGRSQSTGRIRVRWPLAPWLGVLALLGAARWRVETFQPDAASESLGYLMEWGEVYCKHSSECKLVTNTTNCGKCSEAASAADESACKLPANASCACISGKCERADLKRAP